MRPNPQETPDLDTLTEEILNEKLHYFVQCWNTLLGSAPNLVRLYLTATENY